MNYFIIICSVIGFIITAYIVVFVLFTYSEEVFDDFIRGI